jgi:hypothetical protein
VTLFDARFVRRVRWAVRRRVHDRIPVESYYRIRHALNRRKGGSIWFTPECPSHIGYSIVKICAELGIERTREPSPKAFLGIAWADATICPKISNITTLRVLNERCTDISKSTVQDAFERVFAYRLAVDPTTRQGKAVEKSNANALHDGRIVQCPIAVTDPNCVYEILIDNTVLRDSVEDIRIPVVGKSLPFAYRKRGWVEKRFQNHTYHADILDIQSVTSADERATILRFTQEMGLGWGELDTLRDRATGRLHIVDVNKTPFGPPAGLSWPKKIKAIRTLADAFARVFIKLR